MWVDSQRSLANTPIVLVIISAGDRPISNEKAYDDYIILNKDSFDPDTVFNDDVVDHNVILAVDVLT